MHSRNYAIVEVPSMLGLRSTGVDKLPATLLSHGLAERIQARHAARVVPPARTSQRDSQTRILNAHAIASYTHQLADAVGTSLDKREFPVVLGGDCSILLGPALALRRRGRYGLLFIDGQADFFQPEADPYGEAASMDLALVTGHGPALLTRFDAYPQLIRDTDAVAFGFRDAEDQAKYGSQPLPEALRSFDLPAIRKAGIESAAKDAVAHLCRAELAGFWIHIDADCLDDAVMPAVDFRLPDGLTPQELHTIVSMALNSDRAVGLEITIYNPDLDTNGHAGKLLTDLLVNMLTKTGDR